VSGSKPQVAVVYNEPVLPADHPDAVSEGDVVEVARAVADGLSGTGFDPVLLSAGPPLAGFVARLTACGPDFAFNIVEGFGGKTAAETYLTAVFELLGIPYTGPSVEALATCRSKSRTKAILRGHGLPTAPSVVVGPGEPIPRLDQEGPVVVKPDAEGGSLGIDQGTVVTTPARLSERVEQLHRAYGGSVLIETYLPGPEFNVGVIALPEPEPLPVAQVMFAPRPGAWPILTYAAKWETGSEEDLASPIACPAPVGPELAARLGGLAVSAFRATGCRDYGRVDLRLDERGEPMILEVNPNPDLGPNAGWARAARVAGIGHPEAVAAIARQALARGASRPAGPGLRA
jgi:D-alanine-D-alanine ligase